jgi:hypothetical protein
MEQEASTAGPLHIDTIAFPGCHELANLKKKRKMKNRHLMKIPYIISKLLKFTKLQPGGKVTFLAS